MYTVQKFSHPWDISDAEGSLLDYIISVSNVPVVKAPDEGKPSKNHFGWHSV